MVAQGSPSAFGGPYSNGSSISKGLNVPFGRPSQFYSFISGRLWPLTDIGFNFCLGRREKAIYARNSVPPFAFGGVYYAVAVDMHSFLSMTVVC